MKFVKYLLNCFLSIGFPAYKKTFEQEDTPTKSKTAKTKKAKLKDFAQICIFILEILVFVAIFAFYGYGIFLNLIKNGVLCLIATLVATIFTILAFCLISIVIEAIINFIIKIAKK